MSGTFPRDETGAEILQGDLVFYDGAVWKVHEIIQILGGYHLTLFNQNNGYKEGIIPQATTALGADTISGACPQCGGHQEPKKGSKDEDDDDEEDDDPDEDRPPQSLIVAPTQGPLFPQYVFKPGDKVWREMKTHRGYYWREGTVISLEPDRKDSLDLYRAKLVVRYVNGNGSDKVGYWPVKDVRKEAPAIRRVEPRRTDIRYASDRWQDDYFSPYRGHVEFGDGKTDSISRADLISQEARRLANEDRRAEIMRPAKQGKEIKEAPKIGPKLKTRKGEW